METTLSAEQIVGNKLIAEFMDAKVIHDKQEGFLFSLPGSVSYRTIFELKYHSSWEWLMPVVEKISKMHLKYSNAEEYYYPYPRTFGMIDDNSNFMVRLNSEPLFTAPTLIEAIYQAVVAFLTSLQSTPEVNQ